MTANVSSCGSNRNIYVIITCYTPFNDWNDDITLRCKSKNWIVQPTTFQLSKSLSLFQYILDACLNEGTLDEKKRKYFRHM